MGRSGEELAYSARALAQAHPLTPLAKSYLDRAVAEQRTSQPLPEVGIWAGSGLTQGYSLRCVEEIEVGMELEVQGEDRRPDLDRLEADASRVAAELRTGSGSPFLLGEETIIDALDHLVHSQVDRRLEHWRDTIDEAGWAEMEEYLTWWVVKGYALRVAEAAAGALA